MHSELVISDDEHDQAIIEGIRARGPQWIPAAEANELMEQMLAEAEASDTEKP